MKIIIALILISISSSLCAGIHKEAQVCNETGEMCFFWWPILPEVPGWQQDLQSSYAYRINAQAPVGYSFGNADAVIYANAIFKEGQPESSNLNEFIENDQNGFQERDPNMEIQFLGEENSKSGFSFKLYYLPPSSQGNWEIVAYSEETDRDGNQYFLVFVISSRTESALAEHRASFYDFVQNY